MAKPAVILIGADKGGVGKTTVARLLSTAFDLHFEQLSAVFSGVADLKKAFAAARGRRRSRAPSPGAPRTPRPLRRPPLPARPAR